MLPVRVERRHMPSRWLDPFGDADLWGNFDRMIDRVFGSREGSPSFHPADIWEDAEKIHIELEMPGIMGEHVNISYEDGLLRIEGELPMPERKGNVYVAERQYGKFMRTFQIPNVVDPNKIQATFHDGILEIVCEKKVESKPHKIEIQTK
ncbi:MAG: Hsp20/alpha crystallin family protein [Phycisphaerae bacterium]|jgi:HSP20 family protein|nr:Hsp20/alpha crystallin family protein [Phycisphaerae bacterium]